jgi:hypothetical protein
VEPQRQAHGSQETVQPDLRRALPVPITVLRADSETSPKTFFGYARNLSRSGMLIATTNPREPGTQYRLEILLPEPLNLVAVCNCEVVWQQRYARGRCHEPAMGLRFLDMPPEVADVIENWIRTEVRMHQLRG